MRCVLTCYSRHTNTLLTTSAHTHTQFPLPDHIPAKGDHESWPGILSPVLVKQPVAALLLSPIKSSLGGQESPTPPWPPSISQEGVVASAHKLDPKSICQHAAPSFAHTHKYPPAASNLSEAHRCQNMRWQLQTHSPQPSNQSTVR